jgi:hypothetical protein
LPSRPEIVNRRVPTLPGAYVRAIIRPIMIKLIRLLPVAVLASLAVPALAESDRWFGPEVGVYIPTSSKLRDALGNTWVSLGAGSTSIQQTEGRKFAWDWETVSQSKSGSKVFMGSVSYGLVMPLTGAAPYALSRNNSNVQPYWAVRAGASYIDYAVNVSGGRTSGKRVGLNANAELGVLIGDRLKVSARYDYFPEHDGLNFSGVTLSARYGLLRF